MSRFSEGDVVEINGVKQTIVSWPANDEGFFTTVGTHHDGGDVRDTKNAQDPNMTIALVKPVKSGRKAAAK